MVFIGKQMFVANNLRLNAIEMDFKKLFNIFFIELTLF